MKKKTVRIILISLLLIIVALLFIAPRIARTYIVDHSHELIGRQIEIEKLKVNYFRMSASLTDVVLYEENDTTPFVSFDYLYVNLAPWYLFSSELVVQEMLLEGLKAHVIQYDSTFNFDSMIAHHSSPVNDSSEVNTDTTESDPFKFHLSNLELKNGEFQFTDDGIGTDIDMEDLNLFIPYIGWNQDDASDAGLKFFFTNGGFFQSAFQMDPVTGEFDAEVTVDKLDLSTFYGYAAQHLAIDTLEGSLNTYVRAQGNTNNLDSLLIDGWLDLSTLNITSQGGKKLASIDSLYCTLEEIRPMMNRFLIDKVAIVKPYISFELSDSTNNLIELIKYMGEEEAKLDTQENQHDTIGGEKNYPLYYSLNVFEIKEGSGTFTDYTLNDTFYYHLSSMELNTGQITSDAPWVNVSANMLLNERGKLLAEVGLDPSNPMDLDLQLSISEFYLSDLNIYTNHYIGHDIVFGNLYYTNDTKIRAGQIESENKLSIRDIEISSIEGGLITLPLKFALFILKDKNGDVMLDVPLRGDLNDPELSIGNLVWNTFKKAIGRVATSPFNFLAGLVSADPSDLKSIDYAFTDTTFTEKKQKQLDFLLELESKKEGLDIRLVYLMDQELEKEEIAISMAGADFNKKTNSDYLKNESGFMNYLHAQAKNDTLSMADAAIALYKPEKLDSLVAEFTRYRVQCITSYLVLQNDSSEIKVRGFKDDAPKNVGSYPYFEVEYAIKELEEE